MTAKAPPKKRPRDVNQLAKSVVDVATRTDDVALSTEGMTGKDPAAVQLGRKGGLKGGPARALSLSKKERSQIASKAARTRWGRTDRDDS